MSNALIVSLQSKQEIRYGTRAVVTDPFVWFGGKVVPWDKTPYGEVCVCLH